jgi:ParB family chromosome partitioning protein
MEVEQIKKIPIAKLSESGTNPRKTFNPETLAELCESVKLHGVLQPLVVRLSGSGFEVVTGARRLRAAKLALLQDVPCIIREIDYIEAEILQLVAQLQNDDIPPLEEAECYQRLRKVYGYTIEVISARTGVSTHRIKHRLILLNLAPELKAALSTGELKPSHAKFLATVAPEDQGRWAKELTGKTGLQIAEAIRQGKQAKAPVSRSLTVVETSRPQRFVALRSLLLNPELHSSSEAQEIVSRCFNDLTAIVERQKSA